MARITNNFPKIANGLRGKASKIVEATAHNIETGAKESMAEPKSGRMYGTHRASAPGEAPAIDTSQLVNSGLVEKQGDLSAIISFTAEGEDGYPYSIMLEFGGGGPESPTQSARPYLTPAVEAERRNFTEAMKRIFNL